MIKAFENFEVWFVTGAQLLYGGDAVVQVDGHSKEMVEGLNNSGNLPVKVVIINNSFLGMVRQWQELFHDRRYSFVDLTYNPDFGKVAGAYGVKSVKISTKEDLKTQLKKFIESDEGVVIDCIVEKEENVYPMIPAGTSVSQMVGKKGVLENE